ncbi:MAG: hypothetical protein HYR74_10840 [Candidatus Eisenbacteria bacterium]|nr:hypothetical protein [Candidatus Eisenbacteria bacterium]
MRVRRACRAPIAAILTAALAALGGLALVATPAGAGVIHGRVHLEHGVTQAVVCVESLPAPIEQRLAEHHWWMPKRRPPRLVVEYGRFTPAIIAAPVGGGVEIRNRDRVFHAAFSVAPTGPFHLAPQAPGTIDVVRFDRPGVVQVFCGLHSKEFATIVVVPTHAYARPDEFGRFTLPKLPPGTYRVRVWHPDRGEIAREVTLPIRGDVRVEFEY